MSSSSQNKYVKFLEKNPTIARFIYGILGATGIYMAYTYGVVGFVTNESKILRRFSDEIILSNHPLTSWVSFANFFLFGIFGSFFIFNSLYPLWFKNYENLSRKRSKLASWIGVLLSISFLVLLILSFSILIFGSIKYG